MSAKDIIINRDVENDILSAIKSGYERKKTRNILVNSDLTLRIDLANNQIVGIIIEDFSEFLPDLKNQPDYILMEHFDMIINLLNASCIAMSRA